MTTIETTLNIIGQPPAVVAAALFDPDNAVQWQSNLEKFEVVWGKAGEAGAKVHLHYSQKGKSHVMEEIWEAVEPGRRYLSRITGEGVTVELERILKTTPQGTQMLVRWSGLGASWWLRLVLRLLRKAIAQRAEFDLLNFKYLVEVHGAKFP